LLKLVETSPVKPGTIVDHGRYEAFKAALESTARQLGYLDVEFSTKEFYILEDLKGATLKWVITLGPRYRIKDIIFTSTDLSWDFLKKYLKLQPGDFYDFDLILATQQRLNRSGHFASVYLDTDVNKQSQTVSLIYNCSDRQKYQFKSSIGFGTDTGGRLGVEWQDRRVNARGHSYSVNSDLNNINRGVSFNYRIPTASAGSEWINRASYHIQDLEVATSHITSFESRLVYKLDEHWTTQYALLIATEEVYKNQFIDSYLKYVIPMWQVDYYSDIDPFRAESGFHWRSILRLSDATFTSPNLNFQQTEQQFKWLYPLSSHWRLISRSQLGITAINDDSFNRNMPVNYRFFAGGDTSIRGYDYQSLAPVNDSGELLGGRHLVTQTLEFDYRFSDNWRWALFVDAGNSFNDLDDFKVKRSVGTGVRWLTPVGSIRFDVARGLDDPNDWRVHITIGPDL
jgi:translocation and assembly module TamA